MDHSDEGTDPANRRNEDERPGPTTGSELVPWAATAEARFGATSRRRRMPWRSAALAGLAAAGLGLGALVAGSAFSNRPAVEAALSKIAPRAVPEHSVRETTDALAALKSEVAELRAGLARAPDTPSASTPTQKLDALAARLDKVAAEANGSFATLVAKIDPFRQETAARLQEVIERLDRLERGREAADAADAAPRPPARPAEARAPSGPVEAARKPPVIKGWVLREVYDGVALVDGVGGPVEVAPGALLPGAGRVKSIERRGRGWIVVTSRGVIDHAPARVGVE